jgi:hypothetical protein
LPIVSSRERLVVAGGRKGEVVEIKATMFGAATDCTFSAVVWQEEDARFHSEARVFAYPDPAITIPPGTKPKYELTADYASQEEAMQALEVALTDRVGALRWVRWRFAGDQGDRKAGCRS